MFFYTEIPKKSYYFYLENKQWFIGHFDEIILEVCLITNFLDTHWGRKAWKEKGAGEGSSHLPDKPVWIDGEMESGKLCNVINIASGELWLFIRWRHIAQRKIIIWEC